jgi:hypothetical protein
VNNRSDERTAISSVVRRAIAETCFGNRLDEIALRSQFGHRALRIEGAWGVPCLSPHSLLTKPRWPRLAGLSRRLHSRRQLFANAVMAASRVAA